MKLFIEKDIVVPAANCVETTLVRVTTEALVVEEPAHCKAELIF
jgi:hypothetical protein